MKRISIWIIKFNINWNFKTHHVICLNYIINLTIQDFLKAIIKKLLMNEKENEKTNSNKLINIKLKFVNIIYKIYTIAKILFSYNI